jgi:hypothetical protein
MSHRQEDEPEVIEIASPMFAEIKWKLQGFHDADIEEYLVSKEQPLVEIVISGLYFVDSTDDPYGIISEVILHLTNAHVVSARSSDDAFCSHSIVDFLLDSGRIKIETGYGMREITFGKGSTAKIKYF